MWSWRRLGSTTGVCPATRVEHSSGEPRSERNWQNANFRSEFEISLIGKMSDKSSNPTNPWRYFPDN